MVSAPDTARQIPQRVYCPGAMAAVVLPDRTASPFPRPNSCSRMIESPRGLSHRKAPPYRSMTAKHSVDLPVNPCLVFDCDFTRSTQSRVAEMHASAAHPAEPPRRSALEQASDQLELLPKMHIAGMRVPNAGSSDSSSANCPKLVFHPDGGTAKLPRRQYPAKSR